MIVNENILKSKNLSATFFIHKIRLIRFDVAKYWRLNRAYNQSLYMWASLEKYFNF